MEMLKSKSFLALNTSLSAASSDLIQGKMSATVTLVFDLEA